MYKSLMTASALALSATVISPAIAQEAPEPMMDEAQPIQETESINNPVPSESDAPPAAEAATEASADTTTAETEATDPSAAQVAQFVAQGFPTYDVDTSGELNPDEFATWLLALREQQADAEELNAQQASEWAGKAFVQADTDKSQQITQEELTTFLMG